MARKQIELKFYDKTFTIEYNRSSVKDVLKHQEEDEMDKIVHLIKSGLIMHHENELPSDDEVFGWVMAMGDDIGEFANALQEMVQDVLDTFKNDRKNLKWAKVKA